MMDKTTISGLGLELHEACSMGDVDTLEEYLKSGKYNVDIVDPEYSHRTAMHWAASKGHVDCLRLLLDYGADAQARMDMGWTAAHCAAETGKLTILRALHGANIPVHLADDYGDTPRMVAHTYGHTDCVKYLMQVEEEVQGKEYSTQSDHPS